MDVCAEALEQPLARRLALAHDREAPEPHGRQLVHPLERAMALKRSSGPAAARLQRRTTCSATSRSNPGRRGSGASGGRYKSACSASSNGEGSCSSRAPSMPSRRRTKPRSSPVASVAEQSTALPMRSQSVSRSTLPTITGAAQSRAPSSARSLQTTVSSGSASRHRVEREGQPLGLARDEVALVAAALEVGRERRERAAQAAGGGDRKCRKVGRAHAPCARLEPQGRGQRGAVPLHVDEIGVRAGAAVALARPLDLAREPDQVGHADARAEPLGGDVLELVGLVEDDDVVLGKHPDRPSDASRSPRSAKYNAWFTNTISASPASARARSEKQVDCTGQRAPRQRSGPDRELRPEPCGRCNLELGAIARLRAREPGTQPLERRRVVRVDQALLDVIRSEPADVVATALQHDGVDLAAEGRLREREVVVQQLRLQRARRGRDDDGASGRRRRNQVGEALAHPRAGLTEQRAAVFEGVRDRVRHGPLRRPLAKTGPCAGKRTAGRERFGREHRNER